MSSYNDLVRKILNKSKLKSLVDEMVETGGAVLNLVSPEWENILSNSEIYKLHSEKKVNFSKIKGCDPNFEVYTINNMDHYYRVVVAGCWKFNVLVNKGRGNIISVVCQASLPLVRIGQSMAMHNQQIFVDNCRFFPALCVTELCSQCSKYKNKNEQRKSWCILNTKVFDGERVFSILQEHILEAFGPSKFYGVMLVDICSRTTYGENRYKIGGSCREFVAFNESALKAPVNCDCVYLLPPLESPQVTYVEEEENESIKS